MDTTWTTLLVTHTLAASIALPLGAYQLWRRPRGDARGRERQRPHVALDDAASAPRDP